MGRWDDLTLPAHVRTSFFPLAGASGMQLLEFQAKELLARFGIEVPRGRICGSADEAGTIARESTSSAVRPIVMGQPIQRARRPEGPREVAWGSECSMPGRLPLSSLSRGRFP